MPRGITRLERMLALIDDERVKDTDKEADVDFMNAIVEALEERISVVEGELERDWEDPSEDDREDDELLVEEDEV